MHLRPISLVAVVAVALLAAGCGSSSTKTTSTTDWVNGVCSSVATWQSSIKASTDSIKGGNLSQDSLKTAAGDMKSATETLQSDLKDLGKPNTQAGPEGEGFDRPAVERAEEGYGLDQECRRRRLEPQQRRHRSDHRQHDARDDGDPDLVDRLEPQTARPQGRAEDRIPAVELLQEALELELAKAPVKDEANAS